MTFGYPLRDASVLEALGGVIVGLRSDGAAVRCLWCRAGHYVESASATASSASGMMRAGAVHVELECDECGNLQRFTRVGSSHAEFVQAVADLQVWPPRAHE